jgi:hypothetical protein
MSQKLTLAVYLQGRGEVKSLTRIEAEAFGVPYPLVSGWPARHGDMEVTRVMLEDLAHRIACARRSTASKARRGLDGVGGPTAVSQAQGSSAIFEHPIPMLIARANSAPSFPRFVLRPSKRSRCRLT